MGMPAVIPVSGAAVLRIVCVLVNAGVQRGGEAMSVDDSQLLQQNRTQPGD